ncbi:MAG: hypothetical protein ACREON_17815, partial [Gemmatimonadaceae bacterium]
MIVEHWDGPNPHGRYWFCSSDPGRQPQETWIGFTVVKGVGSAFRTRSGREGGYDCGTADYPCFIYSGTQTVHVIPSNDKLQLSASRTDVLPGDSVIFTASLTTGGAPQIREWVYVEDGHLVASVEPDVPVVAAARARMNVLAADLPPGTASCTGPANPCKLIVQKSGYM